jgi:hypothetical protein
MKHVFDFLDDYMKEFYEERAAILEFEAGYPKEKAEALAKAEAETYRARMQKSIDIAGQA